MSEYTQFHIYYQVQDCQNFIFFSNLRISLIRLLRLMPRQPLRTFKHIKE